MGSARGQEEVLNLSVSENDKLEYVATVRQVSVAGSSMWNVDVRTGSLLYILFMRGKWTMLYTLQYA